MSNSVERMHRRLEADLQDYRIESDHIMRAIQTMEADHRSALIRAEQAGYDRAIRDAHEEQK